MAKKEISPFTEQCAGGSSFRCKKGPYRIWDDWRSTHDAGTPYCCRSCKLYMGCSKCAQIPRELVCLKCHEWAMDEGEKEHGKMMRPGNPKVKILVADLTAKMTVRDIFPLDTNLEKA